MLHRKTKLSLAVLLALAGLATIAYQLCHDRPSTLRGEDLAAASPVTFRTLTPTDARSSSDGFGGWTWYGCKGAVSTGTATAWC